MIEKNKVVSIAYVLKNDKGEVLDLSPAESPLEYLHGAGNLIVGMEKALEGRDVGEKFSVTIPPADAYGEYSEKLIFSVPRANFGEAKISVGDQFEADFPDGSQLVTVLEISADKVKIDANHELAGKTLFFDVEILAVRDATDKEIALGRVRHSCGGCNVGCNDGGCGGNCGGDCSGDGGCGDDCHCKK